MFGVEVVSGSQGVASEALRERVRSMVSEDRFAHIRRVVALATAIAQANGFAPSDVRRVGLAALLHDAARDLADEQLLALAPPGNELEAEHPLVLHGRASRVLAERWGVSDEVVLGAIEGHVFGVPSHDLVGAAVYVADVSEPGRGVNQDVRELAMADLPAAYRKAVASKVEYLRRCGKAIHPSTLSAYESLHEEPPEEEPLHEYPPDDRASTDDRPSHDSTHVES